MKYNTIHVGDCIEIMRGMEADSIDCCVTSPPYWGLRDYGTAKWEGGDPECDHKERIDGMSAKSTLNSKRETKQLSHGMAYKHTCPKCGAIRIDDQIGLEQSPDEYIAKMVAVFAEVRRVLKPGGTCWLNLGDSYAGSGPVSQAATDADIQHATVGALLNKSQRRVGTVTGLKPKDLCMIPARVALALQADGWWLRSDIIWAKPNPMPESCKDRPTSAHEHVFLLTKSAKYWYDADAIAEPLDGKPHAPGNTQDNGRLTSSMGHVEQPGRVWAASGQRNARNVWTIATKPYKEAHFATFPPEIPRRCILAGCPESGIVLDPFFGSGTTGEVAETLGRRWVGIELNPEYAELAKRRTQQRGIFTCNGACDA
jgi:site-specific DNA-methyltransferase (cytosine-N4-specific)